MRWVLAPPRPRAPGLNWQGRGPDVLLRTLTANLATRQGRVMRGVRADRLIIEDGRVAGVATVQDGVETTCAHRSSSLPTAAITATKRWCASISARRRTRCSAAMRAPAMATALRWPGKPAPGSSIWRISTAICSAARCSRTRNCGPIPFSTTPPARACWSMPMPSATATKVSAAFIWRMKRPGCPTRAASSWCSTKKSGPPWPPTRAIRRPSTTRSSAPAAPCWKPRRSPSWPISPACRPTRCSKPSMLITRLGARYA